MNSKKLGIGMLILGILFLIVLISYKIQLDNLIDLQMNLMGGICVEDGRCIHDQEDYSIYAGIILVISTLSFGVYLLFFEKHQKRIEERQINIINKLENKNAEKDKEDRFEILLKGLNNDEKNVLRCVKEQEGILQSTLRIRTGMSKTKLSFVLRDLECKSLISKVSEGKKNKIYLKDKI